MARILVTDGMAAEGLAILHQGGHQVENRKVSSEELLKIIGDYDALVVRSATQVTAAVIKAGAPRLKLVGRAGVGVDNIDVAAATAAGVVVMNAPLGNIVSAAEHTIGMIFAAARYIPQAHAKLVRGEWDKKSFVGVELHGKVLGIIGLGKIGKHVAQVMQAAGMTVIAHDPFLSAEVARDLRIEPVDLETLLARADVVTVHTPLTDQTRNMLDAARLRSMKRGARLINVARGGIIDEAAVAELAKSGHIVAALDVFAEEPLPANSPLLGVPNVILTPHLGASTEEAQTKVSVDIAQQFNAFFASGKIINAVNVQLRVDPALDPYLSVAETLGSIVAQTLAAPLIGLEVIAAGELAKYDIKPLAVAALKGALQRISDEVVNFVTVNHIAAERGITVTSSARDVGGGPAVTVKAITPAGERIIAGSLDRGQLRVQRYDEYPIDLPISGHLLIMEYPDRPGMVGKYGTILGDHRINIARMEVSRIDGRGDALVILTLDDPVPAAVMDLIVAAIKPSRAHRVTL
ncbi:MAG: phosphoglycerate dehydrogenase [Planctomycetota bacterium]|nr:phosphoglycerate dehydrogenase [Planctomycetota bacterium]MCX8039181.1 phosphoglycerate dehydrogenase [Planctomycetota bacterium]MDW8373543.1 phosphoglycerate dehydrogenase [Planctomycetota bacterium]